MIIPGQSERLSGRIEYCCMFLHNCIFYFETDFFIRMAAALIVYCLLEFLLHMTTLKIL